MFYSLLEGLQKAKERAEKGPKWKPLDRQRKAVELMNEIFEGNENIGAVQGPPGTGKTSVVEAFAQETLPNFLQSDKKELLLYVAPTNFLVYEGFQRVVAQLLRAQFDLRSILLSMRVYGSKVRAYNPYNPKAVEELLKELDITESEIKMLTEPIDDNVKIVFATEFQRLSARLSNTRYERINIVVDEASKSPFFRVFVPLARKIIQEPETFYPKALLVLGDPEQAITVPEEFKQDVPLLMKFVREVLAEHDLLEDHWIMLNKSFRIPDPSHKPISVGFYNGELRGYMDRSERLSKILEVLEDNGRYLEKIVESLPGNRTINKTVFDSIYEALVDERPIVVIQTRTFKGGDTYDPLRVEITSTTAAIMEILRQKAQNDTYFTVKTTAPYSDIVDAVAFRLRKRFGQYGIRQPEIATVQSVIGGEADVIITALGKEWGEQSDVYYLPPDERMAPIYAREPEVFNVQLSRHRGLIVLIGNVEKLQWLRSTYDKRKRVSKSARELLRMRERDEGVIFKSVERNSF